MIAPVSAGYARALLRHFGKTADQRGLLLRGTTIEESGLDKPGAGIPASALVATRRQHHAPPRRTVGT